MLKINPNPKFNSTEIVRYVRRCCFRLKQWIEISLTDNLRLHATFRSAITSIKCLGQWFTIARIRCRRRNIHKVMLHNTLVSSDEYASESMQLCASPQKPESEMGKCLREERWTKIINYYEFNARPRRHIYKRFAFCSLARGELDDWALRL